MNKSFVRQPRKNSYFLKMIQGGLSVFEINLVFLYRPKKNVKLELCLARRGEEQFTESL